MSNPVVKFQRLSASATAPKRATSGAACWDLYAAESVSLIPAVCYRTVGTGFGIELPPDHVGLVCSRSGLAAGEGIFVLNSPGVIDEDYRGELKVIIARLPYNLLWPSLDPYEIKPGDRIAQLMVLPKPALATIEVDVLSETERGAGGFGSTGV